MAGEIRARIISTVSGTGGHLASNLGAVEITLALHRTFASSQDSIVWDVGHQCYAHKILTGRLDRFDTLRQEGGLSGFPKSSESAHDSFISGHASTALAVAYGLSRARSRQGQAGHVVAVVGDGAMTGGMAFEGINNIGRSGQNVVVILNDNEMSISRSVGALSRYLAIIRSKPGYFRMKDITEAVIKSIPLVGVPLRHFISESKSALKHVLYPETFFEEFGFVYLGPVDGHSIEALCDLMNRAKEIQKPVIIHAQTVKGKGYSFAERQPGLYHGVSGFDLETGKPNAPAHRSYADAFGESLLQLAEKDSRICAITAAMESGTGLEAFSKRFRIEGRFFDVGIAEQFAVTFGSALAAGGELPVFAVYSTFLQRAYDQLILDASIEKRHLILAIDRAGIVGDDGETHQGIFDIPFLSTIPGVAVYSPVSYRELTETLRLALYEHENLVAIRYPRGCEPESMSDCCDNGAGYVLETQNDTQDLIVSYGRISAEAAAAAGQLNGENARIDFLRLNRIIPLDSTVINAVRRYARVWFVEECYQTGSVGQSMAVTLLLQGWPGKFYHRALNQIPPQSTVKSALSKAGLDKEGIYRFVKEGINLA